MEPLFDKLARQPAVRKVFGTIRGWDKRSNDWLLSKRLRWQNRTLFAVFCLLFPFIFVLSLALLLLIVSFAGYFFLLYNLYLVFRVKQNWPRRSVHLGIFLSYAVPMAMGFFRRGNLSDFLMSVIVFFCPIAVLSHFFYLVFAWQKDRSDRAWKIVKFVIALLVMILVCTFVWDAVVMENLYNDTDENAFGFLQPGDWVSNWDGQHPVVEVDHVVHNGDMGDPDTIKKGWSVPKLWLLWFSFVGVSLMISLGLAWVPWIPERWKNDELKPA